MFAVDVIQPTGQHGGETTRSYPCESYAEAETIASKAEKSNPDAIRRITAITYATDREYKLPLKDLFITSQCLWEEVQLSENHIIEESLDNIGRMLVQDHLASPEIVDACFQGHRCGDNREYMCFTSEWCEWFIENCLVWTKRSVTLHPKWRTYCEDIGETK